MPLGGMLKNMMGESQHPPEKSDQLMVAESLMMELDYQIQETEQKHLEQQQQERREATGVDYSWLMNPTTKKYEMSQVERMEVEEICMKIKPTECGKVINMFRESLVRSPRVEEIARCLRAVVNQVLDTRPKDDGGGGSASIPEWLTKSFTKLRPSSRVMPINNISGNVENGTSIASFAAASPSFTEDEFATCTSVENLPV